MLTRTLATFLLVIAACASPTVGAEGAPDFDVVVYAGTPAGVVAAVAAAREGASVVLLEPGTHLGGMVSGGLGATDVGNSKTVGGIAREYFTRIGRAYGIDGPTWKHEPHVAEQAFNDLAREPRMKVEFQQRLRERDGVVVEGGRIRSVTTEVGKVYTGSVFIDASYEGDLLAQAGVTYTVGREGIEQYGESRAGVRRVVPTGPAGSARDAAGLLPDIHTEPPGEPGQGDRKIMAYTYRLCMTRDPDNRRPFEKPSGYDVRRYTPLLHLFERKPDASLEDCVHPNPVPNGKTDTNNKAAIVCSTNLHNGSWRYPEATYAEREAIANDHKTYVRGLLYFLSHDPRVPAKLRAETREWGLAKDEFKDNDNWPYQLYVRVARRMVGEHVMTEHDLMERKTQPDSIAMGSYALDSHRTQRFVFQNGGIGTEGGVGGSPGPYEIAYRSLVPRRGERTNLLVPVCMSASNVAWCSIRMEPVFMAMGHSAGVAAAMAVKDGLAVQVVPYPALRQKLLAQQQVLSYTPPPRKTPATRTKQAPGDARTSAGERP